jgi:hypothetical protein
MKKYEYTISYRLYIDGRTEWKGDVITAKIMAETAKDARELFEAFRQGNWGYVTSVKMQDLPKYY